MPTSPVPRIMSDTYEDTATQDATELGVSDGDDADGEFDAPTEERAHSQLTVENVQEFERQLRRESESRSSRASRRTPVLTPINGKRTSSAKSIPGGKDSPKPLPPIGVGSSSQVASDVENKSEEKEESTVIGTEISEKSGTTGKSRSGSAPRILSFRRESDLSQDAVSSSQSTKPQKPLVHQTAVDRSDVQLVTEATQTEWSWLEDMRSVGRASKDPSEIQSATLLGEIEEKQREMEPPGPPKLKKRGGKKRRTSSLSQSSHRTRTSSISESEEDELAEKSGSGSIPEIKPQPLDHEIPMLDLSSSSEDENEFGYSMQNDTVSQEAMLPSIGPPAILEYQRETKKPDINFEQLQELKAGTSDEEGGTGEGSLFQGVCEYCHKKIKPIPTKDQLETGDPAQLYCCEDYHQFLLFMYEEKSKSEDTAPVKIDIKPHAPFGSKQARRAAKERAAQRMKEREAERQKNLAGMNQANFFAFARQMKTINYQLSSQKCMDEGWTIRPSSPMEELPPPEEIYCPGPIENTLAQRDAADRAAQLAVFDASGFATSYFQTGTIRMHLTPMEGSLFDVYGEKRRAWHWKDQVTHVHAPPFQPICFTLNRHMSVRVMSQDRIYLTFTAQGKSIKLNVGTRLKFLTTEFPEKEEDLEELYLEQSKTNVETLFDKIQNVLKFPKCTRLDKLSPPPHLSSRLTRLSKTQQRPISRQRSTRATSTSASPMVFVN
ncbi:PREDICTED: glutamate-rich protein 6-like [Branchiostoma belcheri]|uniref:Glutamate-rich protein 6-like n=1 Tax=Branchiostoma belcheri TaxID=7741 RepID=A0A6P5APA9_BRABE|nr:PREDICTED: glutamate-rich protein 6-like [Branchiostoma belcheri]